MDLVDNALNSENYDKLSETIGRHVNRLLGTDRPQGGPGKGYGQNTAGYGRPGNAAGTGYGRPGNGAGYTGPQGGFRQQGAGWNPQQGRGQQNGPAQGNPYSTPYRQRQNSAYNASNAGRAAYDARRQGMMAGQPHAPYGAAAQTARTAKRTPNAPKQPVLFASPQWETTGKLLMGLGGVGGAFSILRVLRRLLALFGGGSLGAFIGAVVTLIVFAGIFLWGMGLNNQAKRFKTYVAMLSKKLYASIKDLSFEVGKSEDFVRRDLKRMISKKLFREGHLDDKETTMIATDALYEQYRRTQAQADALRKEQEELEKQYGTLSADVKEVLEKGNEYAARIRKVNEALPEPEITEKLSRLEMIISKIFARVKEEPAEAKNLSQFMDYYLPTTWKLVSAYREMAEQPVQGENIKSAKREIEDSLDTINDAFETILDGMFKEQAWDVSTDISVMKSMMKQDGLTGSDFTVKKPAGSAAKAQGNVAVMEEK